MSFPINTSLPSSSPSSILPSEDSLSNKDMRQIVDLIRQKTAELEALKQAFENLQNTCVRYVSSDTMPVVKPYDQGVIIFPNGDRYKGSFIDGQPEGKGTVTSKKPGVYESHYEGDFEDGEMHGKGKLTVITEIDEGEFPKGKFVYEGDFQYNQPWGEGEATYPNGDHYTGEFSYEKRPSGQGIMEYANGDRYEGKWLCGSPCGQGIMEYANGDHYTGEFGHEGSPSGQGTMVYACGKRVEGQWISGKFWY